MLNYWKTKISILVLALALLGAGPSRISSQEADIQAAILALHPRMDPVQSQNYAAIIKAYSDEYQVDWRWPVAIFSQESSFKLEAVNYQSRDFGIGQINYRNLLKLNISLGQLLTDADYAILQTFRMLSELKARYNSKHQDWRAYYTRYHSFTPAMRRIYYEKYLSKKLSVINKVLDERRQKQENSRRSEGEGSRRPRERESPEGYRGRNRS